MTNSLRPFTPATLAERWSCSERHVRNLIRDGRIAAFRVGTLWRISAAEVERFEAVPPPGDAAKEPLPEVYVPRIVRTPGMD